MRNLSDNGNKQPTANDDNECPSHHEFGWHAVNVIEDDDHPPWTYSIDFWETWNFPELIIIGRSRATAHHALETAATCLDDNQRPDLNQATDTVIPAPNAFLSRSPRATIPTTLVSPGFKLEADTYGVCDGRTDASLRPQDRDPKKSRNRSRSSGVICCQRACIRPRQ
jgi:hypothetical protein